MTKRSRTSSPATIPVGAASSTSLLLWVAHSDHADLIRQIQYLKVENEVLRGRLPQTIHTTP